MPYSNSHLVTSPPLGFTVALTVAEVSPSSLTPVPVTTVGALSADCVVNVSSRAFARAAVARRDDPEVVGRCCAVRPERSAETATGLVSPGRGRARRMFRFSRRRSWCRIRTCIGHVPAVGVHGRVQRRRGLRDRRGRFGHDRRGVRQRLNVSSAPSLVPPAFVARSGSGRSVFAVRPGDRRRDRDRLVSPGCAAARRRCRFSRRRSWCRIRICIRSPFPPLGFTVAFSVAVVCVIDVAFSSRPSGGSVAS